MVLVCPKIKLLKTNLSKFEQYENVLNHWKHSEVFWSKQVVFKPMEKGYKIYFKIF